MYGFFSRLDCPFEEAVNRVTAALKEEGFGVLTEIDIKATLKAKLGVDTRPHKILGACNPQLAHQALQVEPDISLLLPCNVVVQEQDNGVVKVGFMDPVAVLTLVDNNAIKEVANDVRARLERVQAALQGKPV
jgi:uncharacterized protein (DUF302 family)